MKMRVGIVGLGTIGRTLCQAIDRGEVPVQLVAVTTRHHERASPFSGNCATNPHCCRSTSW